MHARRGSLVAALGATLTALAPCLSPVAGAAERVEDGSFEGATCSVAACRSEVWSSYVETRGPFVNPIPTGIGPICSAQRSGCADGGGGFSTGPHWARLGAAAAKPTDPPGNFTAAMVEQSIQIPAAPATLRFKLRGPPSGNGMAFFYASLGGTPVLELTTAPSATYTQIAIDVSAFAGGRRMLRFDGSAVDFTTLSRSWEVDDVSLDAPDPPSAPKQPAPKAKKCKRNKRKAVKAAKKCRKRAPRTPPRALSR